MSGRHRAVKPRKYGKGVMATTVLAGAIATSALTTSMASAAANTAPQCTSDPDDGRGLCINLNDDGTVHASGFSGYGGKTTVEVYTFDKSQNAPEFITSQAEASTDITQYTVNATTDKTSGWTDGTALLRGSNDEVLAMYSIKPDGTIQLVFGFDQG